MVRLWEEERLEPHGHTARRRGQQSVPAVCLTGPRNGPCCLDGQGHDPSCSRRRTIRVSPTEEPVRDGVVLIRGETIAAVGARVGRATERNWHGRLLGPDDHRRLSATATSTSSRGSGPTRRRSPHTSRTAAAGHVHAIWVHQRLRPVVILGEHAADSRPRRTRASAWARGFARPEGLSPGAVPSEQVLNLMGHGDTASRDHGCARAAAARGSCSMRRGRHQAVRVFRLAAPCSPTAPSRPP